MARGNWGFPELGVWGWPEFLRVSGASGSGREFLRRTPPPPGQGQVGGRTRLPPPGTPLSLPGAGGGAPTACPGLGDSSEQSS